MPKCCTSLLNPCYLNTCCRRGSAEVDSHTCRGLLRGAKGSGRGGQLWCQTGYLSNSELYTSQTVGWEISKGLFTLEWAELYFRGLLDGIMYAVV